MNFLIFGAGALGSVFGTLLASKGEKVVLIGRAKNIDAIKQNGLKLTGIWGEHYTNKIEAYTSLKDLNPQEQKFDYILMAVKSYDIEIAINECKPFVGESTLVVSLMNGYGNIEKIESEFGVKKAIAARVIFGAKIISPGYAEVTVYADKTMIGSRTNAITFEKLGELVKIFSASGIPSEVSFEIEKYLWGKILYNSALNSLSAILNVPYGTLLEYEQTKNIMQDIVKEIFCVTKSYNINLFWEKSEDFINLLFTKLIPSTYSHTSSMLQDINKGHRTEIDALNGAICKLADKKSINTPVNATIARLVKMLEQKNYKS